MGKKRRKRGLRHQERAKAALRNRGHRPVWDGVSNVAKTRKATGFPKDNRKKSQRKPKG
ncbi:MAG: hypothetical protein VYE80_02475 [Candidatus Thermoplasmatota archaeon]|nr:hypothetical protein [Candidatus Thermoplasmatota archaeon]